MISSTAFVDYLSGKGITDYVGVPCSFLTPLVNEAIANRDTNYIAATSEGEAVALAAGISLAGKTPVVMCQNSGLGNMVNPLASLVAPFEIPLLLLVTWRGQPGLKDEPQHELMGRITPGLLEMLEIPFQILNEGVGHVAAIDGAMERMNRRRGAYAFIVQKGTFAAEDCAAGRKDRDLPTRYEVLRGLVAAIPRHSVVVATTGLTGRELFTIGDCPNQFYCVGSMGFASALAAGVAIARSNVNTYVVDGDGSALMHMGNLATIGSRRLRNLTHMVLDNAAYESTGSQPTISGAIDFCKIASGCGYEEVLHLHGVEELKAVLSGDARTSRFILMRIRAESIAQLGRPTTSPSQVALRFARYLQDQPDF